METTADYIFVTLARSGDKEAFSILAERYQPMIIQLALQRVSNLEIAYELAQEAILEAYLSLEFLRDPDRFRSWLYGITLNVCRNYLRQQKQTTLSLDSLRENGEEIILADPAPAPGSTEWVEATIAKNTLAEAISGLSANNRAVANLFYFAQLTLQEIADKLDISVVAVKSRLYKTRQELKTILLPLYPERATRRVKMVKVEIGDILEQRQHSIVVLLDKNTARALPLWVGFLEAYSLANNLRRSNINSPATYSLISSLLKVGGNTLEEIRIDSLKGDNYVAVLKLRTANHTEEVEARPSDALALAFQTKSPIFVTDEIMTKNALPVNLHEGKLSLTEMDKLVQVVKQRKIEAGLTPNPFGFAYEPQNLGFEEGLKGWNLAGMNPDNYEIGIDSTTKWGGTASGFLKAKISETGGYATLMQSFNAENYKGNRLRLAAYLKCEDVEIRAGLAMDMVSNKLGRNLGHDDMYDRPLKGTRDWQKCEVVLDVPPEAETICVAAILYGKGKVWLDEAKLEIVGDELGITNPYMSATSPLNLDFKQGLARWQTHGANFDDYAVEILPDFRQKWSNCVYLKSLVAEPKGHLHLVQNIKADHYRNRQIQVSFYGKCTALKHRAGMTLQVSGANDAVLEITGMNFGQPMEGTRDWQKYSFKVAIPEKAERIFFSIHLQGSGEAWFDELNFEVVESTSQSSAIEVPENWMFLTSHPENFRYSADSQELFEKRKSVLLEGTPAQTVGFAILSQFEAAHKYINKKVKLSGYLKIEGIQEWAGLALQLGSGTEQLGISNMRDNPLRGTSDWHYYELEAIVPENAQVLTWGIILVGTGKVWLSKCEIRIV
jgi:RNA polymerase sigma factor (sigma-70 family)